MFLSTFDWLKCDHYLDQYESKWKSIIWIRKNNNCRHLHSKIRYFLLLKWWSYCKRPIIIYYIMNTLFFFHSENNWILPSTKFVRLHKWFKKFKLLRVLRFKGTLVRFIIGIKLVVYSISFDNSVVSLLI